MFSAPFIRLWILILTPLNFLFSQWKKLVSRFFKTDDDAKMSHEELLLFMEDVEQDGGIDENEGELLRNALEFRDLTAAEILTHRIDLEAVDIDKSHEEISRAFTQSRFSRLLVYRDTIDQIVGVLHQKGFLYQRQDDGSAHCGDHDETVVCLSVHKNPGYFENAPASEVPYRRGRR